MMLGSRIPRPRRRRLAALFCWLLVALLPAANVGLASAASIWTDHDGDGLADQGRFLSSDGATVTVDVWIDAGGFQWTNYLVYLEWSSRCLSYESAEYVIAGGNNFPIDTFTRPSSVAVGGWGYSESGADLVARVSLQMERGVGCCVSPVVDVYDSYGAFSALGAGAAYALFDEASGSCFETGENQRASSWGGVKSLYARD
jgi:hypothetical protein